MAVGEEQSEHDIGEGKENRRGGGVISGQKKEGRVMMRIKITTNWSEKGHSDNKIIFQQ